MKKYFILDKCDDFVNIHDEDVCVIESKTKKYKMRQVLHSNTFVLADSDSFLPIDGYFELEEI